MSFKPCAEIRYTLDVNGSIYSFQDPVPIVRQILSEAAFVPVDEHVLIELLKDESRSLSLEESVDLRKRTKRKFLAFKTDRVFRLTIAGRGYEWGESAISEEELRNLSGASDDHILILDREDGDLILKPGDQVGLNSAGTERIKISDRFITVYLNGDEKIIEVGFYSTEQLIIALEVESGYLLNLLKDGHLVTLKAGEQIRVQEGMQFFSQVPCGASS